MQTEKLTNFQVSLFWYHMGTKYDMTQQPMNERILDVARKVVKKIPRHFAITLGSEIYTTFDVHACTPALSLKTCCHEYMHGVQIKRLGASKFYSQYLDANQRAMFEIEAYNASQEVMSMYGATWTPAYIENKAKMIANKYLMSQQWEVIRDGLMRGLTQPGYSQTVRDWIEFAGL